MKISVGSADPSVARKAKILTGIKVSPEVLSTKNIIWASDAVSFSGLMSCSCAIAFKPSGVAALSSPSILAEKFIIIEPMAGWFFGSSGNSFVNNGLTILERIFTAPPFSPIFMMPIHKDKMPVSPKESLNPSSALSKRADIISENISTSPKKISLIKPTIKAIKKKPTQM